MKLKEDQITDAMFDFIHDCDADELARIAGEMFGGNCTFGGTEPFVNGEGGDFFYDFVPNENYYGAFGKSDK